MIKVIMLLYLYIYNAQIDVYDDNDDGQQQQQ